MAIKQILLNLRYVIKIVFYLQFYVSGILFY